jgi:hypothetical protein
MSGSGQFQPAADDRAVQNRDDRQVAIFDPVEGALRGP